jgi:hypothetical protein
MKDSKTFVNFTVLKTICKIRKHLKGPKKFIGFKNIFKIVRVVVQMLVEKYKNIIEFCVLLQSFKFFASLQILFKMLKMINYILSFKKAWLEKKLSAKQTF